MPAIQVACPECKSKNTSVVMTTQVDDGSLIRRRCCNSCGSRWYTQQSPEVPLSKYLLKWSHRGKNCTRAEAEAS